MPRLIAPLTAGERPVMIAAVRSLLTAGPNGTAVRFKHRGRTTLGIDCIGTIRYGLVAVGREIADQRHYGRNPIRDGLRDHLIAHLGQPIPLDSIQPGDVLLLRWHMSGGTHLFNHVALVTDCPYGGLSMIHALAENRAVVEHRMSDPWPRRIVEAYRP